MIGDCRLCLTKGVDLQDSHILSKFLYRRVRGTMADGSTSDPVVVKDGVARQTGKQEKEYLLCRGCEKRFADAEDVVARLVWKDGRSTLLDRMGALIGTLENGIRVMAPGTVPLPQFAYFGASILWRCSISTAITKCSLGPEYSEEFRRFLFGLNEFPSNAACMITAFDDPDGVAGDFRAFVSSPTSERKHRHHFHTFVLVGVRFWFFVGDDLPIWASRACIVRGADPVVLLATQRMLLDGVGGWVANSRTAGKPFRGD